MWKSEMRLARYQESGHGELNAKLKFEIYSEGNL